LINLIASQSSRRHLSRGPFLSRCLRSSSIRPRPAEGPNRPDRPLKRHKHLVLAVRSERPLIIKRNLFPAILSEPGDKRCSCLTVIFPFIVEPLKANVLRPWAEGSGEKLVRTGMTWLLLPLRTLYRLHPTIICKKHEALSRHAEGLTAPFA
jgi:hypothetical protein